MRKLILAFGLVLAASACAGKKKSAAPASPESSPATDEPAAGAPAPGNGSGSPTGADPDEGGEAAPK